MWAIRTSSRMRPRERCCRCSGRRNDRTRPVVVEPHTEQVAHGNARLGATEVVAGRLLSVVDEVLIRRRHRSRVNREELVLVRSVRIENSVARNDVVRKRRPNHPIRVRRIGSRGQRVVNDVLVGFGNRSMSEKSPCRCFSLAGTVFVPWFLPGIESLTYE